MHQSGALTRQDINLHTQHTQHTGGYRHASAVINTPNNTSPPSRRERQSLAGNRFDSSLSLLLSFSLSLRSRCYAPKERKQVMCHRGKNDGRLTLVSARRAERRGQIAQRMRFMSTLVNRGVSANSRMPFDLMAWAAEHLTCLVIFSGRM
ncbi:uncharacterized protein LY79DRAFT_383361 [Colletotrichum navitas]|uniref:Uncharacterized protein n=1 Tax=Colletotrichum navitas TaxID=681940 RepID=A0AAD8Q9A0_9PEZI|nr:uncharacterized protein LY79DRAFT_383361 [Colletotrichum navitas]KAK1597372.1 hypothetical protein LY79DRAFT_383361 [Colletotrichum navitas]